MKTKGLTISISVSLLLSCASQKPPSVVNAPIKFAQEATMAIPSFDDEEVFSLENAKKRVDALGINDPRLKEHLLNVAIYAAYKAGKTDMIPTVYPIEEEGDYRAKSIDN